MSEGERERFAATYRTWDTEEIQKLLGGTLEPAARAAAELVLRERGAEAAMSTAAVAEFNSKETQARDLSRGLLANAAQAACGLAAFNAAKPFGTLAGFLLGLAGIYVGRQFTRSICQSEATDFAQKRIQLWALLVGSTIAGSIMFIALRTFQRLH